MEANHKKVLTSVKDPPLKEKKAKIANTTPAARCGNLTPAMLAVTPGLGLPT